VKSFQPTFLAALRFSADHVATLTALGACRGKQDLFRRRSPETLKALRQVAIVESSESSNRLEGIEAPRRRIEALVLRPTDARNRSEQEIAGYRDALALVHDSHQDIPFTADVLLQLHRTIYRYLPQPGGHWKLADNEIVERDPSGEVIRVRFRAVSAVETPQASEGLVRGYRDATVGSPGQDPLVAIPLAVFDFLCIHPFTDGNGRVARLLTLLLLYHHDYQVGCYISLERIFEQSRQSYYDTLEASSANWHEGGHDPLPWLEYFWGVLLTAYQELEERVGTINPGRGSKSRRVREAVLRKVVPFPIADIERNCPDISRETVRKVLNAMRTEGQVQLQGHGPGARWRVLRDQ
jgi:Fic family protein